MTILKQLLEKWACKHKWKVHYNGAVYNTNDSPSKGDLPIRREQTLICESCGKIKKITL